MFKVVVLLAFFLVSLNAYKLYDVAAAFKHPAVKDIPWPYTVCGTGSWTIESLAFAAKVTRNTNDDITVTGTADDDTTFTSVFLEVKLNGVFLHSESIPFSASFSAGDTVQFKYKNYIPSFAPPGKYGLTMTFKNGDSDNGCIAFTFSL